MSDQWKEVKARKAHQCDCCCGPIQKGEKYYHVIDYEELLFHRSTMKYCCKCGSFIKQGCSWREARIKAFGSPHLRGWIYPSDELLKTGITGKE